MNIEEIKKRYQTKITGSEKIRVGVAIAIINAKKQILLEKRKDCGWWGLTGGKLELGETIEECGIREIKEETGILIKKDQLNFLGIYSNPKDGRVLNYYDNRVQLIDIIYYSFTNVINMKISEESFELKFFNKYNLPTKIVPPAITPLKDIFKVI